MFRSEKASGDCAEYSRRAETLSIRGGMGLGDSLYVQSIARHMIRKGYRIEACSKWPDVFIPLGDACTVSPFRRDNINMLAHYSMRKKSDTDQFVDCCIQAGVHEDVKLKFDWKPTSRISIGRPYVLVQMPREPMDRTDGYGTELLPERAALQAAVTAIKEKAAIVQVGKGSSLYHLEGIDVDLSNKTTVSELFDLAHGCSAMLGYVSYFVPLAESLDKPLLCVWSSRGMKSRTEYIRLITPKKIFHKATSQAVMDNDKKVQTEEAARSLLN